MENNILNSAKQSTKYWWTSLVIGILAIILSACTITLPGTTLALLSVLFVIGFFVSGIANIAFSIVNRKIDGWVTYLISGIIDILFGILLIALPFESIFVLILYVGFWIMFQSIWGVGISIEMQRHKVSGWGWVLALAIIGIVLSIILITKPLFASAFIVVLFSVALISYGTLRIYYAFKLKSFGKKIKEMEEKEE